MALWVGAFAAQAEEQHVAVECGLLSAEELAEVEARVRATLLASSIRGVHVELECDDSFVTARVYGESRSSTWRTPVNDYGVKETLLACADAALAEWLASKARQETADPKPSGTSEQAPAADTQEPPRPTAQAPAADPRTSTKKPEPPARQRRSPGSRLRGGIPAESWGKNLAFGAEAAFEFDIEAYWLALELSSLTKVPVSDSFTPWEWNVAAEGGWYADPLLGFRSNLAIGLAALTVFPDDSLRVRSQNFAVAPFLELEVSRPVKFGRIGLLPNLGLRLASSERSVFVDNERALTIPVVSFKAGLSATIELTRSE